MKKTIFVILSVLVIGGLLTGCGILPGTSPSTSGKGNNEAPIRTISVTGSGQATIIPDIAYITIGVHTEGANVAEALTSNTQQSNNVSEGLTALGVDQKDIQTTAFNIYPQQQYGPMGEMLDIKYMVDNSVYVTVRDLSKMGEILDTVVRSGANNINGIQFDTSDRSKAIDEARNKAVENAKAQAEELSAAAGAKLGQVHSLSVSSYSNPMQPVGMKSEASFSAGTVPVSAGQMLITVEVYATYQLD